ncbi:MAG: hypothetical protein AB7D06_13410 [Pedobacter sp.]|jgi:hypothetical protein
MEKRIRRYSKEISGCGKTILQIPEYLSHPHVGFFGNQYFCLRFQSTCTPVKELG